MVCGGNDDGGFSGKVSFSNGKLKKTEENNSFLINSSFAGTMTNSLNVNFANTHFDFSEVITPKLYNITKDTLINLEFDQNCFFEINENADGQFINHTLNTYANFNGSVFNIALPTALGISINGGSDDVQQTNKGNLIFDGCKNPFGFEQFTTTGDIYPVVICKNSRSFALAENISEFKDGVVDGLINGTRRDETNSHNFLSNHYYNLGYDFGVALYSEQDEPGI